MVIMQKVDDLNEEQKAAVNHLEGPLLVLAGAGSGKTRVVTHRIARLIEVGVPASEIVALTFTNKAAAEMRERVRTLVGRQLLACTFHSLGAQILREVASEVGLESTFTIYDEKDRETLLKSCFEALGLKDEKGLLKTVAGEISRAKNAILGPQDLEIQAGNKIMREVREVYTLYQQRLREYNGVDFDDLLYLPVFFFQTSPLAATIRDRFSFILVDEYQDTNHAQYLFCRFLAGKHHNICVVGDPDQSIYSWRGADINNILTFEKDFPGAKVIALEKNYRSTNHILKAASHVIAHNEQPYHNQLYSDLGDGEKVNIHLFSTDREEVGFVCKKVESYARSIPLDEMVILMRTNFQSRLFEDTLLMHAIPYRIVGGLSFYMRKEIKDLIAFLRFAIAPRDFMSFARTINLPRRGFGPKALQKLKEKSEEKAIPIGMLLRDAETVTSLNQTQKRNLQDYLRIIDEIQASAEGHASVYEVMELAIESIGYMAILKQDPETVEDRKANVKELVTKAYEWSEGRTQKEATLRHFLQELSLYSSAEIANDDEPKLRLMTLHNAKGLEFDVCFMVGMEEELFPHSNTMADPRAIEEERRLCYVGMTRARRHLYLTSSAFRFIWGGRRCMLPSRFLAEIPDKLTHREEISAYGKPLLNMSISRQNQVKHESHEGRIVIHKEFGKGIIEREYETSLGKTYDVKFFSDNNKRSLVAKFAKLSFV